MQKQGPELKRFVSAGISFLGILVMLFGSWSCQGGYSGAAESITIAAPALEQNALLYVADRRKLFAGNGLNVVVKDYDSGVTAINGMLKGE